MFRRRLPRMLLVGLAAGAAGTIGLARPASAADPQEQHLAQALFDEGRSLMDQGRFAEACPKLAESQRLDPGGGTLLNLGICHEGEGKLATAKSDYEEAYRLATKDGRKDRQKIARDKLAAVEPLVPKIAVTVNTETASTAGLEVKLDGLVLRREAWGVAMPIDPGTHVVEATATGRARWSSPITLAKSDKKTIEVPVLAPLTSLPEGTEGASSAAGGVVVGTVPSSPPPVQYVPSPSRTNPAFVAVLSGTALAGTVSLVSGFLALLYYSTAKSGCLPDRNFCKDESSRKNAETAGTAAWISTISLGATLVGGVAALFISPRITSTSVQPSAAIVPGGGTVGVGARF